MNIESESTGSTLIINDKNNEYNSPSAMISRGLNPYIGSSVGAGVSKSPASGGSAAQAAGMPSL